jgi:hypothetical protein
VVVAIVVAVAAAVSRLFLVCLAAFRTSIMLASHSALPCWQEKTQFPYSFCFYR